MHTLKIHDAIISTARRLSAAHSPRHYFDVAPWSTLVMPSEDIVMMIAI